MKDWLAKYKKKLIIVIIVLVLGYFVFPTKTTIYIENSLGEPQQAEIQVFWGNFKIYNTTSSQGVLYAPKGRYKLLINQKGFHQLNQTLIIKPSSIPEQNFFKHILIEKKIRLDKWEFYDPTKTIKLDPYIIITGTDVLGKYTDKVFTQKDTITYGDYSVVVHDVSFADNFTINGLKIMKDNVEIFDTSLKPNDEFFIIEYQDYLYIKNFITDYLNLSVRKFIEKDLAGFPKQYYLASQNKVVSFGDMIFLLCQAFSYKEKQETYFIPVNKKYTITENVINENDCYKHTLYGYVPQVIEEKAISSLLGLEKKYYPYDEMLNQKWESGEISLTFDIESGRYVHNQNKGSKAINPCDSKITSLGLESDENCDDADRIAWFSPVKNEPNLSIPYPWSSGILGFRTILDLSKNTGIKTTHFLLTKEFEVYDKYDTSLLEDLKELVQDDLIEIGLHSKYHSHLGKANAEETEKEFIAEKQFLEKEFNTKISGIKGHRAPYLSILQNDQKLHEVTLEKSGISYYTHGQETKGIYIPHIPYTLYYLSDRNLGEIHWSNDNFGYVMTIDHPWNLYYDEKEIDGEWFLVYNDSREADAKASVYEAISAGYIPVLARDLEDE